MVFLHVLVVFFSLIFHGLSFIFHWFSCPFPKNIKHRWEHHLGDPDPMILDWSKQGVYYVFNWCEATFSWCHCQAANLADYQGLRYKIPDLAQMARNDRGRGETTDGALPTLTTNSGKLYHKVFWVLFLETDETQQCQYKINLTICLQRHCSINYFQVPLSNASWPPPQDFHRFLSPLEMLNSHCIPTTEGQAKKAGAPRLVVDSVKDRSLIKMAGNAMSLPCVGCAILACVLGLEPRTS